MMRWTLICLISLASVLSLSPFTHAEEYVDESTQLLFSFPEHLQLEASAEVEGQPSELVFLDGTMALFKIAVHQEPLDEVLQGFQLRTIQPLEIVNYELLGTTGVRIFGSSLENDAPLQLLLFPRPTGSISVLYFGSDRQQFEAFLKGISRADQLADIGGHRLRPEIEYAVERGIFAGGVDPQTKRRVFRPDQGINRAELTKILVLAADGVTIEAVEDFFQDFLTGDDGALFPDVDRGAWFAPFIFYAAERGWVKGYADGRFLPGSVVNVAEAAKLILVSQEIDVPPHAEVWFRPFLQYFMHRNILQWTSQGYRLSFTAKPLQPSDWCSRAQSAAFLSRLLMLKADAGTDVFGRRVAPEALAFHFGSQMAWIADDLGESFRDDGREQTFHILEKQSISLTSLVKIAAFRQQAWLDRKRSNSTNSDVPLYYLGETADRVFAAETLCESLKTCTLPEAEILRNFSLR